jgi:hypothetical protein
MLHKNCVYGESVSPPRIKPAQNFFVKCPTFLSDLNKIGGFSTDIRKVPSINIHRNPSNGSGVDAGRQANRGQTDMTRLIGALNFHANALFVLLLPRFHLCKQKAAVACPFFARDFHKIQ